MSPVPIHWPDSFTRRRRSPFEPGDTSPLEITEHYPSPPEDVRTAEAIACLRQLGQRQDQILAVVTGADAPRRLTVDKTITPSPLGGYREVAVPGPKTSHGTRRRGIVKLQIWQHWREAFAAETSLQLPENHLDASLTVAAAHEALEADLLSTTDTFLLTHRDHRAFSTLNVCSPLEACQVLGLLLRNRDNYCVNDWYSVDREIFYWTLMRSRLPATWQYFSACLHSAKARKDDTDYLGQSIMARAKWVLEARDDIGAQFYRRHTNTTSDRMTYHASYFVTLLMGAFDAAARVAVRAYNVPTRRAKISFRNPEFRVLLRKHGAAALADVLESDRFQRTTTIVNTVRNAIHGTGISPIGYSNAGKPTQSRVRVPESETAAILAALAGAQDAAEWGVHDPALLVFEPYTFAQTACRRSFELLNAAADATDVSRLFPTGASVVMMDGPPANWDDPPGIVARLDVLG